ncbi:MAG: hypothetical protein KF861_12990, partial [Planctomycetaceae bacterium]|nr:hypothetical protein [Planctomycetaceae bacterium]
PLTGLARAEFISVDFVSRTPVGGALLGDLIDLQALERLTQLRWLSAGGNGLVDDPQNAGHVALHPLRGLNALEYLHLYGNELVDVRPLAGLDGLAWLDLEDNHIASVDPLAGVWIVDNFESGYREVGLNWRGNENPGAFEGDYRILPSLDTASGVFFEFTELPDGQYEVYATWTQGSRNTDRAVFATNAQPKLISPNASGVPVFRSDLSSPDVTFVEGNSVVNISFGVTGDDASPNTIFGSPYRTDVINGKWTFFIEGDLRIRPNTTINITSGYPVSFVVGNDVVIGDNVSINLIGLVGGGATGYGGWGGNYLANPHIIPTRGSAGGIGYGDQSGGAGGNVDQPGQPGRNQGTGSEITAGGGGGGGGGGSLNLLNGGHGGGGGGALEIVAAGRISLGDVHISAVGKDAEPVVGQKKPGGGGAGGTVKLVGSTVTGSNFSINASGGAGGDGHPLRRGEDGRFLIGQNTADSGGYQTTGARVETFIGPQSPNPFIANSPLTPHILGLKEGAEAYGLLNQFANNLFARELITSDNVETPGVEGLAPQGALAMLVRVDAGPSSLFANYPGYDLVLIAELGGVGLNGPRFGVGDVLQPLLDGGYLNDPSFGGTGTKVRSTLGPREVYAVLIPESATTLQLGAAIGSGDFVVTQANVSLNQVLYLTAAGGQTEVNQRFAPAGADFGGRPWQRLSAVQPENGQITIGLSNLSAPGEGNLVADAVRLVKPVLPNLQVLNLRQNPLDNAAHDYILNELVGDRPGDDRPETSVVEYASLTDDAHQPQTPVREGMSYDPNGHAPEFLNVPQVRLIGAGLSSAAQQSGQLVVAVYDDPSVVDTTNSLYFSESDNVQATLAALGFTVHPFRGVDAADFVAALAEADVLLIPEQETGYLPNIVASEALDVIRGFVGSGGGLVVHGAGGYETFLLNDLFDFELNSYWLDTGYLSYQTSAAEQTQFADDSDVLPLLNATSGLSESSLPPGGTAIYTYPAWFGNVATVAMLPYEAGNIVMLGWDWFDAAPIGSQDSGWSEVLKSAVLEVYKNPSAVTLTVRDVDLDRVQLSVTSRLDGVTPQLDAMHPGPAGELITVSQSTPSTFGNVAMAKSRFGTSLVAWIDDTEIFARMLDADGRASGPQFLVNASPLSMAGGTPHVEALNDGRFVAFWTDGLILKGRLFDSEGVAQGSEFSINNSIVTPAAFQITIAGNGNGQFVIAATGNDGSGNGIAAQRFNLAGESVSPAIAVNSYTLGNQFNPNVAMDRDGNFVVTWSDGDVSNTGRDGDLAGVYARRFNTSGAPLGGDFLVNTQTFSAQLGSRVAFGPDGEFVIVWRSLDQDGDAFGVYAQRYQANGVPRGPEFRVNSNGAGNQAFMDVAIDERGVISVSWSDLSSGRILLRQFDADGAALGREVRVADQGASADPRVSVDAHGSVIVAWRSDSDEIRARQYTGSTYQFRFDPKGDFSGTDTVTIEASDGRGRTSTLRFEVFVDRAAITGVKYDDANGNGQVDGGETSVEGWVVFLDETRNGIYDEGEPFTVTDYSGRYAFTDDIIPGRAYYVVELNDNAWQQTVGGDNTERIELVPNFPASLQLSGFGDMLEFNGRLFFAADGGDGRGTELWMYDRNNPPTRVTDINPGPGGSFPGNLSLYQGSLVFTATDGTGQTNLWQYDDVSLRMLFALDRIVHPERLFALFDHTIDGISELHPVTGDLLNWIDVPAPVSHENDGLAFDGQTLYFLSGATNVLYELDPDTGDVLDSFPITAGSGVYGGLADLGGLVYVLDDVTNVIHVVNPLTNAVTGSLSVAADLAGGLASITGPSRLVA